MGAPTCRLCVSLKLSAHARTAQFYERLVPEGQRYKGYAGPKEEQAAGEGEPAKGEAAAGEAAEGEAAKGKAGEGKAGEGNKAAEPPQDFEAALAEEAAELTDRRVISVARPGRCRRGGWALQSRGVLFLFKVKLA